MSKRGQVQTIAPAILALVFAAILLVFGLVITQALRDTQDASVTSSVANETTLQWTSGVNQTMDKATGECGFGAIGTSPVVYNATGEVIIVAANYTMFADGNMINLTNGPYSNFTWQVSYDYTWGDQACVAGNKTVIGLGTFADFWEIIVLAIVITVVIGLLLVVFGGSRRR